MMGMKKLIETMRIKIKQKDQEIAKIKKFSTLQMTKSKEKTTKLEIELESKIVELNTLTAQKD